MLLSVLRCSFVKQIVTVVEGVVGDDIYRYSAKSIIKVNRLPGGKRIVHSLTELLGL
jgi:hypothetical protein